MHRRQRVGHSAATGRIAGGQLRNRHHRDQTARGRAWWTTGVSKYGARHDRGSHHSGKECARPICCWPSLVMKVPKNPRHLGKLERASLAAGVASKSVKPQRPARATVCSHSRRTRPPVSGSMVGAVVSALNPLNAVVSWAFEESTTYGVTVRLLHL